MLELPLLDFCIGHRLILLRQRNPLLWQPPADFNLLPFERQTFWLIEAIYTCAQSFAMRQRLEKAPGFSVARLRNRLAVWCWHRRRKRAKLNWPRETAKFQNYLASARIITEYKEKREGCPFMPTTAGPDAKGRALGAPCDAALIQFLCRELHMTEAAALEYPLGLAQAHYLTFLEREGNLRILNAFEMEFEDMTVELDLKAAKEAGFATVVEHQASIGKQTREETAPADTTNSHG